MVLNTLSSLISNTSRPASVVTPRLSVTINGQSRNTRVVGIHSEYGLLPCVDAITVNLAVVTDDKGKLIEDLPELDQPVTVGINPNSDAPDNKIFDGTISEITHHIPGIVRIVVTHGASDLAQLRVLRSFESVSAGDIVEDLCNEVGVDTDTIESGIDLPYYLADNGRNALNHIANLARNSGYVSYFSPEGELLFVPFASGSPVASYEYGTSILKYELTQRNSQPSQQITGEGTGSSAFTLIKNPSSVQAGDGSDMIANRALRTGESVSTAAGGHALLRGLTSRVGKLTVSGDERVTVGSTIDVTLPDGGATGFVTRLRHSFQRETGFLTHIVYTELDASGGIPGLDSLLGLAGGLF